MNYAITHTTANNEIRTEEWFVPRSWGWTEEQVKDSFEVRHLNVNVSKVEVLQCC